MNILVAVASKHRSTQEIAEAIGQELRTSGHTVQVLSINEVDGTEGYDAVILGSALYMGTWLAEARQFVDKNRAGLLTKPVWLFSSGPLGQSASQPRGDVAHLQQLMDATQARGHRNFAGKLDRSDLGLGERLVATVVRAPEGDFRDWEAIREWAREITVDQRLQPALPL